jgi:DNA-binding PadR family transcriptional regulator
MGNGELKKGSTELIVLSLLEERARHGYEIRKLVGERSRGVVELNVASLYPLLYRMETRRWIQGRWVEKPGERRRRFYRLTPLGLAALAAQRDTWREFSLAIDRIIGVASA